MSIRKFGMPTNTFSRQLPSFKFRIKITTAPLDNTTWVHIVVRYNGVTLKVYKNTIEIFTDNVTGTLTGPSGSVGTIGGYEVDGNASFDGRIDDVRIYNRALSTDDIATLYAGGDGTEVDITPDISTGLVIHYKMNDTTSLPRVVNNIGGYNGTAYDSVASVPGKINNALSFDGSGDKVDFSISTFPTELTNWSWCLWIKANSIVQDDTLMSNWTGANKFFGLNGSGNVEVYYGSGWKSSTGGVITTGSWFHLAFVMNSDTGLTFYINGVPKGTDGGKWSFTRTGTWNIAARMDSYPDYLQFNGVMDDVRLYNKTLSDSDVLSLWNIGNGTEEDGSIIGPFPTFFNIR